MNTKQMCGVVVAAAVLVLPCVLLAQSDPSMTQGGGGSPFPQAQPTFPQSPQQGNQPGTQPGTLPQNQQNSMPNGTQPGQPQSMRDSLGAPGLMGQQILDKEFVRKAQETGLGDVKLAMLAEQKGSPDVKDLAQKIADDHTAMDKEMGALANSLGVLPPKKVSKEDQEEYDKLNGLSGKAFDTEYLTYILKAHWGTLHSYYMEASAAADTNLQQAVVKDLGTMHQHLGMIAKTAEAEGITLPPRPPRPGRQAANTAKK